MKNTWLHVHECALLGLPAAVRGDQCLHLFARKEASNEANKAANRSQQMAVNRYGEAGEKDPCEMDKHWARENPHSSGLLLVSGAALWLFLPLAGGKNAVSDSVRELVRPLPYRLISNANCLGGGGDGTTQQFNGLCFLHASIEP